MCFISGSTSHITNGQTINQTDGQADLKATTRTMYYLNFEQMWADKPLLREFLSQFS